MTDQVFERQTIASTKIDSQGERLSIDDLRGYVEFCRGRKVPLHQHHQMDAPTTGYIENVRLIEDFGNPGEWMVVGDLTVQSGKYIGELGGFSISFTAPLVQRENASCLLYIPYPHYNDDELVSALASDPELTIGKWIKKSADPAMYALFGATIVFVLRPAWDHLYKTRIAPVVDRFLDANLSRLRAKGLKLEHIQVVLHAGHEVEIRFIPAAGKEEFCFSEDSLIRGIGLVAAYLENDKASKTPGVQRVVLRYEPTSRAYEIVRTEYRDGEVVTSTDRS